MSELYQMKPLTTEDGGFYYPVSEKERYFYSKYPDTGRIFTNIVEWQADYETGYARAIAEVYLDTTLVSRAEAVVFARSCIGKPHEGMFADTAATKAVGKALSQFGIGIDDSENRIPSGPVMHPVVPLKPESVPVPPEVESASPPSVPVQSSKVASPAATKAEKWSNRANVVPASCLEMCRWGMTASRDVQIEQEVKRIACGGGNAKVTKLSIARLVQPVQKNKSSPAASVWRQGMMPSNRVQLGLYYDR